MDATLKRMYSLLAFVSRAQPVTTRVYNGHFLHSIFKTPQLQVHPPLNILTVPDWLKY